MSELPTGTPPVYNNSRPGLIGCGVVHLLFGLMFLGFCGLMLITFFAGGITPARQSVPAGMGIYTSGFYLILAVLFAVLGVGSIMARRWAPPLIQVTSWGWLLSGVIGGAMMVFVMPQITASMPPGQPGAGTFVMGCMAVMTGVFGIAIPLAFILFYRRPDVKTTVERLDPVPRWTDRHPVPILIFAAWMFFGAVCVLLTTFMYRALPLGRFMLRGLPMFALFAAMATLMFWIGVGTLQRKPAAWWSAIVLLLVGVAWGAMFIGSTDTATMYEAMGMTADPQQAAIANKLYSSPFFYGWMAIVWIGYLAFLLYLRRYFFGPPAQNVPRYSPPSI